jgi:redox-sensitive bicupin YhaK (pirin superfamily)
VDTFEIRRGADRARTRTDWLDSAHSFAFGSYYDPDNLGFGALLAFNCDILQPGPGYPVHAHADVEILTWVLAGSLSHRDEAGTETVVSAGQLHHLSAGSGIRHTEASAVPDQAVHLVQMWLGTDQPGRPPLRQLLRPGELAPGRLVLVAAGTDHADGRDRSDGDGGDSPDGAEHAAVLRIRRRGAALSVARLPAGASLVLPAAPLRHAFVAAGSVEVRDAAGEPIGALAAGDALRMTGGGDELVTAGEPAELLVWALGVPAG